jgi:hypothetical protein
VPEFIPEHHSGCLDIREKNYIYVQDLHAVQINSWIRCWAAVKPDLDRRCLEENNVGGLEMQ